MDSVSYRGLILNESNINDNLLSPREVGVITYMAIGIGTGSSSDTLVNEIARVRVATTYDDTNNKMIITGVFPAGVGTGSITEVGLFGGITATSLINTGDMFNRAVNLAWNKPVSMEVTWIWTLQF
jgi:hypothetical protein